jgi:hypothetical protein
MDLITKQLDLNEHVNVDFKISILKPILYSLLFSVWLHISNKQEMVKKDWEKCGLLYLFDFDFQKEYLLDNMKISLFKQETNAD